MPQAGTTIRHLLFRSDFRRLLATRLLAQFGDGVFQAALAGTVLFNPQRAAEPLDIAAGFAVLLLPYSLVGPFAGVWLDRWSRRQVLLRANVVRAGLVAVVAALILGGVEGTAFYAAGLAVFSVNRFVLSALSAGLPHTTDEPSLVSANALSTTAGGVSTVVGGAAALLAAGGHRRRERGLRRDGARGGRALPGRGGRRPRLLAGPSRTRPHGRPACRCANPPGTRCSAWSPARDTSPPGLRRPPRCWPSASTGVLRRLHAHDAAALPEHLRGRGQPVPRRDPGPGTGRGRRRPRHAARRRGHASGRPADRHHPVDPPAAGRRRGRPGGAGPGVRAGGRRPGGRAAGLRGSGRQDLRGHHVAGDGGGRLPRPGLLRLRHALQRDVRGRPCWSGHSRCRGRASPPRCRWRSRPATWSPPSPTRGSPAATEPVAPPLRDRGRRARCRGGPGRSGRPLRSR